MFHTLQDFDFILQLFEHTPKSPINGSFGYAQDPEQSRWLLTQPMDPERSQWILFSLKIPYRCGM